MARPTRSRTRAAALAAALCCGSAGLAAAQMPLVDVTPLATFEGDLLLPTDIAACGSAVYVVDSGHHRVVRFGSDGTRSTDWRHPQATLKDPIGIACDATGGVWVADSGNRRLVRLDAAGKLLQTIAVKVGDRDVKPVDLAWSPDSARLFVSGNDTHSVLVFDSGGELIAQWGRNGDAKGEFRYPATVALTGDGRVAVVDVLNSRAQLFAEQSGLYTLEIGEWGVLPGQLFRPKGIAIDGDRVLISDSYLGVVQMFGINGRLIGVIGNGGEPKRLDTPVGMAIDGAGRLYIAEMLSHRITVLDLRAAGN